MNDAINTDDIPVNNKVPGNVMGKDLQYCIYYNLILRTRRRAGEVIDLIRRNNYVPSEKYSKQTTIASIPYSEYLFFSGDPNEVDLKETKGDYKYRQSKVCPRCFTVYQIVQKYFESADRLNENPNQRLFKTTSSGNLFKMRTNSIASGMGKSKGSLPSTNDPLHTSVSGVAGQPGSSPQGGTSKSNMQNLKPISIIHKMGITPKDHTAGNKLKQLEKGQMLAMAFNQAVDIARKTVTVTQHLKNAVHSRNNSEGASSLSPAAMSRLPKEKLRKVDNANMWQAHDEGEDHINQLYKTDKLVLGLQLKKPGSIRTPHHSQRADSPSKGYSGRLADYTFDTILHAGANFVLYTRAEEECVQEVEAYRQHTYTGTLERREKNLQEMVQKIYQDRREHVSPEGINRQNGSHPQLRSNRKAGVDFFSIRQLT